MTRLAGKLVLDASVVVECLGEFSYPKEARVLLEAAASTEGVELWAPDLVYPESVSALRKLTTRGALSADDAKLGVERILRLPLLVSSTAPLMKETFELRDLVTVYDACYVVLARRLNGALVTADAPLARTMRQLDADVIELGELS